MGMVVRETKYVMLIGMLTFSALAILSLDAYARDIYVDVNYPYSNGDGSAEHPYTSIQQAIDIASDGDSIYVFPGIYNETLRISKSITLQGLDRYNTTIWKNASHKYTIEITSDFVTLEDFTIEAKSGCYFAAIYISSDNVIVQGNIINITADVWSIYLDSSDGDTIGNNVVNGGRGICAVNSVNDVFTNNRITNATDAGIKLYSSKNMIIYGNILSYNQYGLYAQDCENLNLSNNTLKSNRIAGANMYRGSNNSIYKNTVEENPYGIKLASDTCTVKNTTFDGNTIALVMECKNSKICLNTFTNSTLCGIDATHSHCEGNTIFGNKFKYNSEHARGNDKNQWDNGTVGNYWDDYNNVDRDRDGIGDYPYSIAGGGQDRYPTGKFLKPPNKPENISPRDGETNVGLSPTLKVKVSDPDSETLSVYFYRASDNTLIGERHGIPSGGIASYTIHLPYDTVMAWYVVVNDSKLENISDIWVFNTVSVPPTNDKPVANPGGPYKGLVNEPIQFDGTESYDPDGEIRFYRWDFGDGSGEILADKPVHIYKKPGNYTVTLTVIDNNGTSSTSKTYALISMINNTPPVSIPGGPYKGEVGKKVTFDASQSYDLDGEIVIYEWDFGDGSSANGKVANHTYSKPGTYMVTLTVTDDKGEKATAYTYITINESKSTPGMEISYVLVAIMLCLIICKKKTNRR